MMKRGIVIAFPGIRYTCRQQLMQDCLAFYTARGYETLCLDFAGVPFDGTADMAVQRSWLCRRFWDGFPAFVLQTIPMWPSLQKAWGRSARCVRRRRWGCGRGSFC